MCRVGRAILLIAFVCVKVLASDASAQTTRDSAPLASTTLPTDIPVVISPWAYPGERQPSQWVGKRSWDLSLGAAGLTLDTRNHDTLGLATVGTGYYLTNRISANLQLDFVPGRTGRFTFADNDVDDASVKLRAFGGLASLRAEVLRWKPVSLYVDGGIGGLQGHGGFLPGRAESAWMEAAGGGLLWRLGTNGYLSLGARYVRLSDRLISSSGSRAANGVEYYFGLMCRL
jgi:opacity protein-like surface antigen